MIPSTLIELTKDIKVVEFDWGSPFILNLSPRPKKIHLPSGSVIKTRFYEFDYPAVLPPVELEVWLKFAVYLVFNHNKKYCFEAFPAFFRPDRTPQIL